MTSRDRAFAFTINNPTSSDLAQLLYIELHTDLKYMCFGCEKETQEHLQGCFYFRNPKRIDGFFKEHLPRAHVEACKGDAFANFAYCIKKCSDFYETGEYPQQGKAAFYKIEVAMKYPERNMQLFTQYRKSFREVMSRKAPPQKKRTLVLTVIENLPNYIKDEAYADDDAYNGEKLVLCDVMYDLPEKVKRWAIGIPVKVKFGYETMYYDPDMIVCYCSYKDAEHLLKHNKKYFDIIDIE